MVAAVIMMMIYHTVLAHRARDYDEVCWFRRRLLLVVVVVVVVNHVPAVGSTRRQAVVFVVFSPTSDIGLSLS